MSEAGESGAVASSGGPASAHLAMPGRSGVAACGRWSKRTTTIAELVTCAKCRQAWDFALAEAKSGARIDEAAFRAVMQDRCQVILARINSGEIAHPYGARLVPDGYRLEWEMS